MPGAVIIDVALECGLTAYDAELRPFSPAVGRAARNDGQRHPAGRSGRGESVGSVRFLVGAGALPQFIEHAESLASVAGDAGLVGVGDAPLEEPVREGVGFGEREAHALPASMLALELPQEGRKLGLVEALAR